MALTVLCAWTLTLAVRSVAEVPDPRPASLVVDQAAVLDDAAERRLDAALQATRTGTGAEVALVVLDDVPGSPKEFATALFAHWGLGRAGKDDGVLVLMVMGQRRLEIETGIGMEAALPAWWLAEMQAERMVPRFKQRDFAGGFAAGIAAIDGRLRGLPAEGERDTRPGEYRSDGVATTPGGSGAADRPAGAPGGGGGDGPRVREPAAADDDHTGLYAGLGLGGLGLGGGALLLRARARRRRCDRCKVKMLPLDELADDAHLSEGQRTEERIGSVNYEVLICPGCQTSRTLRHARWFSGKSTCSACGFKTETSTSHTLVQATYDHGGTVEVTEDCAHCKRHHSYRRSTPRRTRPSSTSSSSSSSRSSWSSSSSRSSSSSSRSSSSGGGRSRGGGAGSSW